jgi:hypothetical protein
MDLRRRAWLLYTALLLFSPVACAPPESELRAAIEKTVARGKKVPGLTLGGGMILGGVFASDGVVTIERTGDKTSKLYGMPPQSAPCWEVFAKVDAVMRSKALGSEKRTNADAVHQWTVCDLDGINPGRGLVAYFDM